MEYGILINLASIE